MLFLSSLSVIYLIDLVILNSPNNFYFQNINWPCEVRACDLVTRAKKETTHRVALKWYV